MVVQSPETQELTSIRLGQEFNSTGPPPVLIASKPNSYLILTKKESVPIGEFYDLDRKIPAVENEKSMLNITAMLSSTRTRDRMHFTALSAEYLDKITVMSTGGSTRKWEVFPLWGT
jgi:hypothetical protein